MNIKTYLAIGAMMQAAAHAHGLTGPVQFTVCRLFCYPLYMESIEDHEDRLTVIAPVVPGAKFEARCHLCTWSFHKWTDDEARTWLRTHIIDEHLTPISEKPFTPPDRRIS